MRKRFFGVALAALVLIASAYGDAIFELGNHPQPLDLIFHPFKPASAKDLVVTAVTNNGTFTFTYGDTRGNDFLTITTIGGETISSVTIDSASGFQDLKQPRISGISGVTIVPELSSMLLLGSGLLVVAMVVRCRLR